jgi:capsular exopolysaccharide synthesis family protein
LDEQKRAVFAVDQNAADFAILRHDAESSRNLYDAIQYKLKETGLLDTLKSTQFRMVDEAQMPSQPAEPQRAVILLGTGLVGMFLGCMGALAVGFADDAVYSSDDLERITGRPVLGAIPRIQVSGSGKKASVANDQTPSTIILLKEPTSSGAEAFRGLRSSLLLSFVDKTPQIQVVTSAAQGEGKSLIAINYAASLAQRGAKVLVVDADLRRGMLHHRLGIPLTPGLTNLLSSLNEHVEEPQAPFPDLPNLSVLPRGPNPPNPVELLDSRKMTELLDRWRSKYDFIILDSAPLLPVADTFALASKSDMVLFIVRIGSTRRRSLVRMLQMLDRAKAPVGGLIINDVSRSLDEYAYYYGDYGYYHSDKKSSSR